MALLFSLCFWNISVLTKKKMKHFRYILWICYSFLLHIWINFIFILGVFTDSLLLATLFKFCLYSYYIIIFSSFSFPHYCSVLLDIYKYMVVFHLWNWYSYVGYCKICILLLMFIIPFLYFFLYYFYYSYFFWIPLNEVIIRPQYTLMFTSE